MSKEKTEKDFESFPTQNCLKDHPVGALFFNTDHPDQLESFKNALSADQLRSFVDMIYSEYFRPYLKYDASPAREGKSLSEAERNCLEAIWEKMGNDIEDLSR